MLYGPEYGPTSGAAAMQLVVLLHGLGADGADLIGLAPELAEALPRALFVAPDAPDACDMGPFGRQWFSLADRSPAAVLSGAEAAAAVLDPWLDGLLLQHRLPASRLALVGFSQGAMTALLVGLRRPQPIAGVAAFSGALPGADRMPVTPKRRPPVLLIHGEADGVVPFAAMAQAEHALRQAGVAVTSLARPGLGHGIDQVGLTAARLFLAERLAAAH